MPSAPILPSSIASSRAGIVAVSNHSARWGRMRSSAKSWTASRVARSSSLMRSSVATRSNGVLTMRSPCQELSEECADAGFRAADEQFLDLAGALVERHDAGITQVLLHRILVDVAVAAEDLDGVVGRPDRCLAGEVLGLRRRH